MTQEEKAKRYDEAIEKAKGVIEQNPLMDYLKKGIEYIFPELKESEDEKMLREIKRYIKDQGNKPTGLPNGTAAVADMLAWLEKQGEQKSAWSEEDENRFNNLIFLVEFSDENKATKEGFIKFINKLKSLRPQNRWKPSEEYILVVESCMKEFDEGSIKWNLLKELLEQLKQL